METEKLIPPTLMECFRLIEQEVAPGDIDVFENSPESHSSGIGGWGLYLRNRFIHPHHSLIQCKFRAVSFIFEPNGMSSAMKKLFWMYLNGQKLDASAVAQIWIERHILVPEQMTEQTLVKIEDLLGG